MSEDAAKLVYVALHHARYAVAVNDETAQGDQFSLFEDALERANKLKRLFPERRVSIVRVIGDVLDVEKMR